MKFRDMPEPASGRWLFPGRDPVGDCPECNGDGEFTDRDGRIVACPDCTRRIR